MITESRSPMWWSLGSERRLLRHLESLFTVPLLYRIFPEGPRRRERLEDYVLSASELKQMRVQFKKVRRRRAAVACTGSASCRFLAPRRSP
jgi:hypothetical protein